MRVFKKYNNEQNAKNLVDNTEANDIKRREEVRFVFVFQIFPERIKPLLEELEEKIQKELNVDKD